MRHGPPCRLHALRQVPLPWRKNANLPTGGVLKRWQAYAIGDGRSPAAAFEHNAAERGEAGPIIRACFAPQRDVTLTDGQNKAGYEAS